MRYYLKTLVDITETKARRGEGSAYQQQQNFMTALQTIGIRANPSNVQITKSNESISKLGFGTIYKGKQNIWTMHFEIEYGATSEEMLATDFNLVPFITGLEETIEINQPVFFTQNPELTNIIFGKDDK